MGETEFAVDIVLYESGRLSFRAHGCEIYPVAGRDPSETAGSGGLIVLLPRVEPAARRRMRHGSGLISHQPVFGPTSLFLRQGYTGSSRPVRFMYWRY